MVILIENMIPAAILSYLFGIPESIDVLLFGIGLIAAAVITRRYLGPAEPAKRDEEFGEKA